jgi:Protein of unknown function (DUF3551)
MIRFCCPPTGTSWLAAALTQLGTDSSGDRPCQTAPRAVPRAWHIGTRHSLQKKRRDSRSDASSRACLHRQSKEIAARERAAAFTVLGMGTILTAAPAQAQTYDPRYPVCMQVYSRDGSLIGCGYTSMAECAASASGRAAQCFANPYFARTDRRASRRAYRRLQGPQRHLR